jgi:hypothetical protein
LNGELNAVVETAFDVARAAAPTIDRRARLAGIPFLAKDMNIEVRGLRLTSSCRWLSSLPPATVDAPLAERWRAAGLSILGRTNTPEFAGEFVTEPTWRGPTKNPWTSREVPEVRAAGRPRRWHREWFRSPTPPIRGGRSACPRRRVVWWDSSPPAASIPSAHTWTSWRAASIVSMW